MAARLLCRRSRLVAYMPNIRAMATHFRTFSSFDEKRPKGEDPMVVVEGPETDLPDPQLGVLGPQDHKFPLPGMVGPIPPVHTVQPPPAPASEILTQELTGERHLSILKQFANAVYDPVVEDTPNMILECTVQECPQIVRKDFADLFPDRALSDDLLTVITLSQQTKQDQSGWNQEVEEERELLLEAFIESAQEICDVLQLAGYWADFIDPSSGRPFLGPYTNATLYETDDRYRHFGFDIDDLGCCKVIRHHIWGTHAYIGSLFTNAPCDHPILTQMSQPKMQ